MYQMDPTQRLMVACEFAGRDVQMSHDASVAFESPERIVTEGERMCVYTEREHVLCVIICVGFACVRQLSRPSGS